ncbi:MAG TPA: DUF4255 domain-containing protein, partial [Roseiflexaceae bacterium]|nr:DUF4255 domain-containing protein [Roseiflexaceae bacterium]
AVLRDLLQDGLIDHDVGGALGDVTVSVLAPARVSETLAADASQLNLFLYHISPNSGWRNHGLPVRDARGTLVSDPPLALNLHYLLTAYTNQEYLAELLLGYAMQLLHETPVLTRDAVRTALAPPAPVSGAALPGAAGSLVAADLAEQVEQVRLTAEALSIEQMTQIWGMLQSHYRPSVAYQASVVLIESRRPTRRALPVRQANIYTMPVRQPRIELVASQITAADPVSLRQPILPGYRLVLRGMHLRGDDLRVRVGDQELSVAASDVTDGEIRLALPAGLRAGVQGVQVIHRYLLGTPATPHRGVESNVAAFVLHPTVSAAAGARAADGSVDLTLTLNPPVGRQQRVIVLLNQQPAGPAAHAYSFAVPSRAALLPADGLDTTLVVATRGVVAGTYLVRVQVDGAESPIEPLPVEPPGAAAAAGPLVTIP